MQSAAPTSTQMLLRHIPVDQINVDYTKNNRNPFTLEDLQDLIPSVRQYGLIQPVLVVQIRPDYYELVAGFRRMAAVKHLGIKTVPCAVLSEADPSLRQVLNITENTVRRQLGPMEEAKAVEAVRLFLKPADIAKSFGWSTNKVNHLIALLSLPPEIQEDVQVGKIPLQTAPDLLRIKRVNEAKFYEAVRKIKTAIEKKARLPTLVTRKANPRSVRVRNQVEMAKLRDYLLEAFGGPTVASACMGWACGLCSTATLNEMILEEVPDADPFEL